MYRLTLLRADGTLEEYGPRARNFIIGREWAETLCRLYDIGPRAVQSVTMEYERASERTVAKC